MTSAVVNLPAWCNVSLGFKLIAGGVATILVELVSIVALRTLAGKKMITEKTYENWTIMVYYTGVIASAAVAIGTYAAVRAATYMAWKSHLVSMGSVGASIVGLYWPLLGLRFYILDLSHREIETV